MPTYSQPVRSRDRSGSASESGPGAGADSSATRALLALVARATWLPMLWSWATGLWPARIADATPANSVASRSRAAASLARRSASAARRRAVAASRPTTTPAIISTPSSTTSLECAIVSRWRGMMNR